jgi:hypothetical protein
MPTVTPRGWNGPAWRSEVAKAARWRLACPGNAEPQLGESPLPGNAEPKVGEDPQTRQAGAWRS